MSKRIISRSIVQLVLVGQPCSWPLLQSATIRYLSIEGQIEARIFAFHRLPATANVMLTDNYELRPPQILAQFVERSFKGLNRGRNVVKLSMGIASRNEGPNVLEGIAHKVEGFYVRHVIYLHVSLV